MAECEARIDVAPDGLLWCTREKGHPGIHCGAIWWYPLADIGYVTIPEPDDIGTNDHD